jgi:hypothetical protein
MNLAEIRQRRHGSARVYSRSNFVAGAVNAAKSKSGIFAASVLFKPRDCNGGYEHRNSPHADSLVPRKRCIGAAMYGVPKETRTRATAAKG